MTSAIEHTVVNQAWSIRQGNARGACCGTMPDGVGSLCRDEPSILWGYGITGYRRQVWGGEPYCEHEWGEDVR